jgi:hypothetical protein
MSDRIPLVINRTACRAALLAIASRERPEWGPERVSGELLDDLNRWVYNKMFGSVKRHPSVGKTINQLY